MNRPRRSSYQALGEAEMNLTPLIDVVFVVLIIFIVIAPMLEFDRVELATGASIETSQAPEASVIAIHVHHDNTIWLNGKCMTPEQLTSALRQTRPKSPGKIPQLFQDKHSSFGTYQAVKNGVEAAGYTQMDVILKPHD